MTAKRRGPRCTLYEPRLAPDDLTQLRAALQSPEVSSASIYRWLDKKGVEIGPETVKRHRRGECYCRRES